MTQSIAVDISALVDGQNADSVDVITPILDIKTAINNTLNGDQAFDQINTSAPTTLTIASGAITIVKSSHKVDTEGAAASDDLDTINGGVEGDWLILRTVADARDVVVKHGTGNIKNNSEQDVLIGTSNRAVLLHRGATYWTAFGIDMASPGTIGGILPGIGNFSVVNLSASTTTKPSMNMATGVAPTVPVEGDKWADSTQKTEMAFIDGIKQARSGVIFTQTADVNINTSAAEATLLGTGIGTLVLPANFLVPGKTLRIKLKGFFNTAGAAPTINVKGKFGSTVLCTSGAVTTTISIANKSIEIEWEVTCRTAGAGGTVYAQGRIIYVTATAATSIVSMVATAAVTIDTTASQTIDTTLQFGTSNASNNVTITNASVEVLN